MDDGDRDDKFDFSGGLNVNWPGAILGIAFLIFLFAICYGKQIIEALSE